MGTAKNGMSTNMRDVMASQYPTADGWICKTCRNYLGDLRCKKGVLICWVGANMADCWFYHVERRNS